MMKQRKHKASKVNQKVIPKKVQQPKAKKGKSEEYILKKNTGIKAVRVIFWIMLIFFFIKGLIITFKPDDSIVVSDTIDNFKTEFASYKDSNEEILGFAQNFVKEYLTYTIKGDIDYKSRIEPYVSSKIYNLTDLIDLKGNAKVIYAQAYRKESYSETQVDVYVQAEIEYEVEELVQEGAAIPPEESITEGTTEEVSAAPIEAVTEAATEVDGEGMTETFTTEATENATEESIANIEIQSTSIVPPIMQNKSNEAATVTKIVTKQATLKVPIYIEDGNYIVEDLPIFVSDSMKINEYTVNDYSGATVSDGVSKDIAVSLNNFLAAYYEQEQSVIEYYLSKTADKDKFKSLAGRYRFDKIDKLNCYQEEGQNDIICIVGFKVIDSINEVEMYQEFNLTVQAEGNKYYIDDINTKTGNLK